MPECKNGVGLLRIDLHQVGLVEFVRRDDLLWRAPLLATLAESVREEFLGQATVSSASPGQSLLEPEAAPEQLFFVLDGSVVLSIGEGGIGLATLGKGDFFGLGAVFRDAVRCSATAAEGGARVALFQAERVAQLARAVPAFGQVLANIAKQRRDRSNECSEFFDMW